MNMCHRRMRCAAYRFIGNLEELMHTEHVGSDINHSLLSTMMTMKYWNVVLSVPDTTAVSDRWGQDKSVAHYFEDEATYASGRSMPGHASNAVFVRRGRLTGIIHSGIYRALGLCDLVY